MNLRFLIACSVLIAGMSASYAAEPASESAPPAANEVAQPGVTAQLQSPVDRAQLKKASLGSKLFVAPVLWPGRVATVTAVDKNGVVLPNISVLVNGVPSETNQEGRARFMVPKAGAAMVVLPMEDETKDVRVAYAITPGGAMVVDPALSKFVDTLFAAAPKKDPSPRILYSPAVVQVGHPISLIGMNFDGQGGDKLLINNVECEVLAGSPGSLLARLPAKSTPQGPVQEMFVTTRGEASTAVEVDTVTVESTFDTIDGAADGLFKVDAVGTKMPVLLRYENNAPSSVSIRSIEGAQLPASGWAMTPGGSEGTLALRLNLMAAVASPLTIEVAPDLAVLPDAAEDEGVRALAKNLMENRIIRLKRQLLAIESQIPVVQKARADMMGASTNANVSSDEIDRLTATLNALTLRQARIASALSSHRAIFLAVGGSDEQYRTAVDEAAGGAYLAVERKSVAPPADSFAANAAQTQVARQRRLAEPRMKVLPPEDWNGKEFVEVATTPASQAVAPVVVPALETPQAVTSTPLSPPADKPPPLPEKPASKPQGTPAKPVPPAKPAAPGKSSPSSKTDEKAKKPASSTKAAGAKKPAAKAEPRTTRRKGTPAATTSRRRQKSVQRGSRKSTRQTSKRTRRRGR